MKKVNFNTTYKKILSDVYTPVSIYLRLRDKFRDTILLESTDFHVSDNSFSIIGINAIAGIEISQHHYVEYKLPAQPVQKEKIENGFRLEVAMQQFLERFEAGQPVEKPVNIAQAVFGYTSYDAVPFFENIHFNPKKPGSNIPLVRYRLYQYVIIINHFKDEMYICENHFAGVESKFSDVENIIRGKDVPVFPFEIKQAETSNITDDAYKKLVQKGMASCQRGDVFQIVLSRKYEQAFTGDEFNVYRALRSINPSPYLFYFDYGDYKLMGSSPESQVVIEQNKVIIHPIAGTFKRTGNDDTDTALAIALENDKKETAEHVMLVDLARNDLSRVCADVKVTEFKKVKFYSHVIHLVSEVEGKTDAIKNPFTILGSTFPAGTLSGAPKYKAMQLIDEYETTARSFYGGAIGFIGLDGNCNHAIMIRTFLSSENTLQYQAGAGITVASIPENELMEVNNKLGALKKAIEIATTLTA
ncbi:MAG: anthranilate synthase component I family protein [Bacteroidetes bacterium]|nr:anthranilate synthase component I family protein [Bacteroidota bacterium]MBS1757752.1 anthranilate synthase component I family protein [Bacteroidota bacterium]